MDNAKYHLTISEDIPKSSWKKEAFIDFFQTNDIPMDQLDLKTIIWGQLKKRRDKNVKPMIVNMAEVEGHHSDLKPIELAWVNVKGKVGQ